MVLLRTGISGFDQFLRGGLSPSVLLLIGSPGSGNDVFARQVAYSRIHETGVTYFTLFKTPESIKDEMASYGWDISSFIKTGAWRFVELDKTTKLDLVTNAIEKHRCTVIDSLSEILLKHNTDQVINMLNKMSAQNRETQELHLVLATEGMQDQRVETTIQHFSDSVMIFSTTYGTEAASRSIIIKKIKGADTPTRILKYSIGRRGLRIETAIRIT
jgi:KaiC/GvpD/RAD55 family RecA-like ATPase